MISWIRPCKIVRSRDGSSSILRGHKVKSCIAVPLGFALVVATACASGQGDEGVSPIELSVPKSAIPSPGLCRVWVGGADSAQQPLARSCEDIEWTAPLGARILYRPADGSREVIVRYMSRSTPGWVTGIDVFDIDTLRLVRVIQSYTREPVDTMVSQLEPAH